MSRNVKKALGTLTQHTGLTQVTTPKEDGTTEQIQHTTKKEMEQACLDEAR